MVSATSERSCTVNWMLGKSVPQHDVPVVAQLFCDSFMDSLELLGIARPFEPHLLYRDDLEKACITRAILGSPGAGDNNFCPESLTGSGEIYLDDGVYRPLLLLLKAVRDVGQAGYPLEVLLSATADFEVIEASYMALTRFISLNCPDPAVLDGFIADAMTLGLDKSVWAAQLESVAGEDFYF
ncbi:hypothetical protein IQ22_04356 [Pseudomonas duriflava]|uniref:Uncharacterized protein n=1 Tax=Pseudomonas duriflava TaxID=459528 RepID=A0A562PRL2_9PSED|nr:hypothetical protein [Pseudomonas duriflava]TWI47084.1 hypothetical protein IQ22_04356 [Pseudomonas duriflava]